MEYCWTNCSEGRHLLVMLCMEHEATLPPGHVTGRLKQQTAAGESEPGYPAGSTVEAKVSIREWPLMSVINALRDKPPGAGFQLEPDDVRAVWL